MWFKHWQKALKFQELLPFQGVWSHLAKVQFKKKGKGLTSRPALHILSKIQIGMT